MARVWKLDRKQYGDDGLLSLYRGDDWNIYGSVVDRVGSYETLVDLLAYSVTGYFPSASGGADIPTTAVTGSCGVLSVTMPASQTPNVLTSTGGEGLYVVFEDNLNQLQTIATFDDAVAILDRGFPTG